MTRTFPRVLAASAFLMCAFACGAHAVGRATKEQMAARAAGSEALWLSPYTNYSAICAVFIKPGVLPKEECLSRLRASLIAASNDCDRAAVNYLMAETHYWGALSDFEKTKDKSPFLVVANNAAGAYLPAWEAIQKAGRNSQTDELRRTIVIRFNILLASPMCGACMSTNLKQEVVAKYVDKLDKAEQSPPFWSIEDRGKAFRNLGIGERVTAEIPTEVPNDFESACRVMRVALAAGATNDAIKCAVAIEDRFADKLNQLPYIRREIYKLYQTCGDSRRAGACIMEATKLDANAWLDAYRHARQYEPSLSQTQRVACLNNYLTAEKAVPAGQSIKAYNSVVSTLVESCDYELAIQFADRVLSAGGVPETIAKAYVWRLKGMAHEKLGETEKAKAAYQSGCEIAEVVGSDNVKELFRKSLRSAGAQTGGTVKR